MRALFQKYLTNRRQVSLITSDDTQFPSGVPHPRNYYIEIENTIHFSTMCCQFALNLNLTFHISELERWGQDLRYEIKRLRFKIEIKIILQVVAVQNQVNFLSKQQSLDFLKFTFCIINYLIKQEFFKVQAYIYVLMQFGILYEQKGFFYIVSLHECMYTQSETLPPLSVSSFLLFQNFLIKFISIA